MARNKPIIAALLLLGLAALERLLLWVVYQPVVYSDTHSYRRLAEAILNGWSAYDGTRTPGYPAFLAWVGSNQNAWLVQMLMGVAITLCLYFLAWWLSKDVSLAFITAAAHLLNLGQLFFEANLLTETLATFWIMLALVGMVYGMLTPARRSIWLAACIGIAASLALLTRPMFVYLPPWVFLFIWAGWGSQWSVISEQLSGTGWQRSAVAGHLLKEVFVKLRQTWQYLLAFSLPVIALVGGWVGFIYNNFGSLGLSTMTGYHLVQHTGVFFEYVPDQYAALRDTYLKYRAERIEKYGTQANTIWDAIPEMQEVSGMGFYELSDTLGRISARLIAEHPALFARNLVVGWWKFWYAPVYWSAESLRWQWLAPAIRVLVLAERVALFACNLVFIITTLLAATWRPARRLWGVNLPWTFLLTTIWVGSLVQTVLDHGDNPRFLVPLQSLVVLWVLWVLWKTGDIRRRTAHGAADHGMISASNAERGRRSDQDRSAT